MSVLMQALVLGFALLPGQTITAQVGALYEGGDAARPQLNRSKCDDLQGVVDVRYTYALAQTGTITTVPVAVLYTQDVNIPAASSTTTDTTTTTTTTSPVTCSEPADDNILLDNIALSSDTGEVLVSSLLYLTLDELMGELCDEEAGVRKRRAVCLGIRPSSGSTTVARGGDGPDIDTEPPGAPGSLSAQEGDAIAIVDVGAPADADATERAEMTYVVQYRRCTPEEAAAHGVDAGDAGVATEMDPCGQYVETSAQASPVEVSGLDNDVVYQLRAYAVDGFGNAGPASEATAFVTPRKEYGFLDLYGAPLHGASCGHARVSAAEPLLLLVMVAVVRGLRRRRRGLTAAA
ncbi:MAG: hypothetical protein AB2A00_09600 [Myxococcota bacterium]